MNTYSASEARLRWLLAGRFTGQPSGQALIVSRKNFSEKLAAAGLKVSVEVPDTFAGSGQRKLELAFSKLNDFSLAGVAALSPPLQALAALAKDLGSANPEQRPSREQVLERVVAAVGAGELSERLSGLMPPSEAPAAKSKDVVGAIVASVRGEGYKIGAPEAKKARALIEDQLYAVANAALHTTEVQTLEGAWRGLAFIVAQIPKAGDLELVILDVSPDASLAANITAALPDDPGEQPDAIFVVDPVTTPAALTALADLAESFSIATLAFAGADAPDDLRAGEACRWLALVTNRFAVSADGKHRCFASPVLAVAAMLSASQITHGTAARVFGQPGALSAPAVSHLEDGETMAPVEAILPRAALEEKSAQGITVLGCVKNSDRLVLASFPTLKAGGVSFPAQLITGRVLRFARWVRDQLVPTNTAEEITQIYGEASRIFLFPGVEKGYHVAVQKQDTGNLLVSAWVSEPLCGMDLRFSFPLSLAQ